MSELNNIENEIKELEEKAFKLREEEKKLKKQEYTKLIMEVYSKYKGMKAPFEDYKQPQTIVWQLSKVINKYEYPADLQAIIASFESNAIKCTPIDKWQFEVADFKLTRPDVFNNPFEMREFVNGYWFNISRTEIEIDNWGNATTYHLENSKDLIKLAKLLIDKDFDNAEKLCLDVTNGFNPW